MSGLFVEINPATSYFPTPERCSIIGSSRLNFRVRDGVSQRNVVDARLTNNQAQIVNLGLSTDKPVAADYDGDGRIDQRVYRNGEWNLNRSSQGYAVVNFGLAMDKTVPAGYDGDAWTDIAVYFDGYWNIIQSSDGNFSFQEFGLSRDIPIISAP